MHFTGLYDFLPLNGNMCSIQLKLAQKSKGNFYSLHQSQDLYYRAQHMEYRFIIVSILSSFFLKATIKVN